MTNVNHARIKRSKNFITLVSLCDYKMAANLYTLRDRRLDMKSMFK